MHSLEGDLFTEGLLCYLPRKWKNLGRGESVELRFIEERKHETPLAPMTASTGKGGGAWPPMMIP